MPNEPPVLLRPNVVGNPDSGLHPRRTRSARDLSLIDKYLAG